MKLIIIILFSLSFSVWGNSDECTAAEAEFIVTKGIEKTLKHYRKWKKNEQKDSNASLFESLTLSSGLKVIIKQGGCHHFSRTYSFVLNKRYKKPNDIKNLLKESLSKVEQIKEIGLKIPEALEFKNLDMKNKYLDVYEYDESLSLELGDGLGYKTSYFGVIALPNDTIKVSFSEGYAL